jgi:chitin synthase
MSLKAEKVEDEEMQKDEDIDCLSRVCLLFFDIQKAQQIEYHFAHLIDKPFESIFKFIHVLPGAFSGYSMDALRPVNRRDALLREYFKSIDEKLANNKVVLSEFTMSDIIMRVMLPKFLWKIFRPVDPDSEEQVLYNENIYLAEDRILCMGIHKNEKDIIFMPDAYAEVDPIKTVNGLMGQRKRWINGSMFAFEKVQKEMDNFKSEKMATADRFLKAQIFYLNFSNTLVYFAPAILLFTFHLTMETIRSDYLVNIFAITDATGLGSVIYATFVQVMDLLYIFMFSSVVFLSIHLTHSNKKFIYFIYLISTLYGIFSVTTFVVILIDLINGFAGLDNCIYFIT